MNAQTSTCFFSVIIPTFNRESFIKQSIDSVLNQTYANFELIVVDDGSTDATQALLKLFNDDRLQIIIQENHGVAHARNRGIEKAQGEYLAFLDSDDEWREDKLAKLVEAIAVNSEMRFFHHNEIWYREGTRVEQLEKHKKPDGDVYLDCLLLCCIGMSTAVMHKNIFRDYGLFDESMDACEDYDLFLRITANESIHLVEDELSIKDGGRADQLSMSVWGQDRFRIAALVKMLDSGVLSNEYKQATLIELKKKSAIYIQGKIKRGELQEAEKYQALVDRFDQE